LDPNLFLARNDPTIFLSRWVTCLNWSYSDERQRPGFLCVLNSRQQTSEVPSGCGAFPHPQTSEVSATPKEISSNAACACGKENRSRYLTSTYKPANVFAATFNQYKEIFFVKRFNPGAHHPYPAVCSMASLEDDGRSSVL
jgi:hypothetical protein